jgi:acyl-CoA dehydrogenase
VVAVVAADADGVHIGPGRNIAGEPRDDAVLTSVEPVCAAVAAPPHTPVWFEALGAAARSVQIAGAAERALSATLRHISERVQFGRPLVRFQVIQHQAARLAADVMTIRVASDAAVLALRDRSPQAPFLVAAAKAEASTLARHVAAVSHQLHGAIGFTREHLLGTLTSRLWSWREEHGNETVWWDRLAQSVDPPGHEVWEVITGVNSAQVVAS